METINFKDFMRGHTTHRKEAKYHSIVFNPLWLIDKNILILGGVVVGIVLVEKFLVLCGHEEIAEAISNTLKVLFPIMAIGSIIFFLVTNPIMSWL